MPTGAAVVAEQLTKRFGSLVAVDGLDLTLAPGEVFGYLGPNGAGKTTTLRLLLGSIHPTLGLVRVLGQSPLDPTVRRHIGYLPADLHLDPRHTAQDVFGYFGALRGGVDKALVDELVQRFGLDPTRPVRELSSGNRRKIGVIQAFMHRPSLLILDEPSSGLDPLLQHEFHELVRASARDGATVLLSSHVLPEVEMLAERVGILRAGRLVDIASVVELRARARQRWELQLAGDLHRAVAALRGAAGVVEATTDGAVIHLVIEGNVDAAVKVMAGFNVRRLVTLDTDLEDVFLTYYRSDLS